MFQVHEKVVVSSMSIHHQIFHYHLLLYASSALSGMITNFPLAMPYLNHLIMNYELVLVKITFAPS